jgi:hypothetical protein
MFGIHGSSIKMTGKRTYRKEYSHKVHVYLEYHSVCPNDDLFDRLETVRFFRLFTREGNMENRGRGNTEPRGLKARVLP